MNTRGIRDAFALAVVAALLQAASRGAEVNFPNADGSGDLASPAAWGTETIPAATDRPKFTASMDVTASADATFAGLALAKAGISVAIDLTNAASQATAANPRRMTLGGNVLLQNSKGMTMRITGGIWDFQSLGGISMYGSYGQSGNNKLYLENCLLTNVLAMTAGYGDSGVVYSVGRGARVYTRKAGSCGYQAQGLLEVKDGGALHVSTTGDQNDFNLCNGGSTSPGNEIRVTGTGSFLDVTGMSPINMPSGGNPISALFHVTDHAYAALRTTSGYKFIGAGLGVHTAENENRWVVDNGGVLYTSGANIDMSIGGGSSGSSILVGDGGVYTNDCYINLGSDYSCGPYAELCVSNGFYRGRIPRIGLYGVASSNCGVRITGPRARVEFTTTDASFSLFAKGSGCYFVLDDHAVLTNDVSDFQFTGNVSPITSVGSNQLFEVRGGASYVSTRKFQISDINYRSWYNTLRVCDGGLFSCSRLATSSIGNTLAVSNGTVKTSENLSWCYLSQSTQIHGFSNCYVRVQGTTPRIDVAQEFALSYYSTLFYELEPSGYAEDYVPLTAKTISVQAGSMLRVTGLDALYRANGRKRKVYTLATATSGITLGKGVLEEANEAIAGSVTLADHSRLERSADGTRLNLVVNGSSGTTVVIR